MKKTSLLIFLFILIGSIAVCLITQKPKKTTVSTKNRDFAVENIALVNKIILEDDLENIVTLRKRTEGNWYVNGRWKANANSVSHLLTAIQKIKIKYIPPEAAQKNIIKDIITNPVNVKIYAQDEQLLKAYQVGGVTNDELGTHMMMEGSSEPFVVYIPGFEGGLRVRYHTDEEDWRDKTIFSLQVGDIRLISIDYPKQKNRSFQLERRGNDYVVEPLYNTTPRLPVSVSKGMVKRYLYGFERLIAEGFENNNENRASLNQQLPFALIRLVNKSGEEKVVKLYPIFKRSEVGEIVLNETGTPLVEKYFADVNGEDLMLIQQLVFGKILWSYESFFQR